MTEQDIFIALAVFLVAGTAKGLIGIGLPTIAISILVQVMDPRQAIVLTLGPIFFTNLWQCYRAGEIPAAVRRYTPYLICLCGIMFVAAQFAQGISEKALVIVLGAAVVVFTLIQLLLKPPPLGKQHDLSAQVAAGVTSGVMGGVTAIWGPPVLMYLISRRVPKEEFVRATGVLLVFGSIPLIYSYWSAGLLPPQTFLLSSSMTVPAVIGFALGERYRKRLNAESFQKAVLVMFLFLGLNILRRGFFGV